VTPERHGTKMRDATDTAALAEEERRVRRLKRLVDVSIAVIMQADLTMDEALDIVNNAKSNAVDMFPDKEETFDLIYGPRLRRALAERFGSTR